jgi:hypothetical protein
VDSFDFVLSCFVSNCQKFEVNTILLSEIISYGML